jgi:hypothetical protein
VYTGAPEPGDGAYQWNAAPQGEVFGAVPPAERNEKLRSSMDTTRMPGHEAPPPMPVAVRREAPEPPPAAVLSPVDLSKLPEPIRQKELERIVGNQKQARSWSGADTEAPPARSLEGSGLSRPELQ